MNGERILKEKLTFGTVVLHRSPFRTVARRTTVRNVSFFKYSFSIHYDVTTCDFYRKRRSISFMTYQYQLFAAGTGQKIVLGSAFKVLRHE